MIIFNFEREIYDLFFSQVPATNISNFQINENVEQSLLTLLDFWKDIQASSHLIEQVIQKVSISKYYDVVMRLPLSKERKIRIYEQLLKNILIRIYK